MAQLTANAQDITCEGCANAIRRALGRLEGILEVAVDVPSKDVKVQYDDQVVSQEQILKKLSNAGFDSTPKA